MQFRVLFTVSVSHSYYSQGCADFDFILPVDSDRILANGRLIAKVCDGKLRVFHAVYDDDLPLVSLTGTTLRVGLKLLDPFFGNFTALAFPSSRLLYRNVTNPNTLDAPESVTLIGQSFRHSPIEPTRPVTLTVKDRDGSLLRTATFSSTGNEATISLDLTGRSPGVYSIEESYPGQTKTVRYYADSELQGQGIFGVVEISIADSFYTAPPDFTLSFTAKQETLKYYVIAKNYSDSDFAQLSIFDPGETGRSPISFTKILPPFTGSDSWANSLGDAGDRIVLFQSQNPVSRQQKARQKIRLQKNGETLIANLPQPGADRLNSDLIVQVSKPKP